MPLSPEPSKLNKYVCRNCIDDPVLRGEIVAANRIRKCSYCGRLRQAVSIEAIALHISPIFEQLVGLAEDTIVIGEDSGFVEFRPDGSTPQSLMTEMIKPSVDGISEDIVDYLSEISASSVLKDGEPDLYDQTSDIYEISIPKDPRFAESWSSFCDLIKHHERHFNANATTLLDEILEPIVSGEWPRNASAIRVIGPETEDRFVFRGRLANSPDARTAIYLSPIRNLATPPPKLCTPGRMNPAGIGVFYGSFDTDTCVAELRAPVGGYVVVGKFEILRPLRVLDMTVLDEAAIDISYFNDELIRDCALNDCLRGFHRDIKRPIIPGAEPLDYLPTQFIAEYLWAKADPRFDGIIFGSSQISGDGRNLALFPHASWVAGAEGEVVRSLSNFRSGYDAEDEVLLFKTVDGEDEKEVKPEKADSLRLLTQEIELCGVQAIKYEIDARQVRMYRVKRELTSQGDVELDI